MQYIIEEKDLNKKKEFYNYIHKKYNLKDIHNIDMINTPYPLVVDLDEKDIWICTSITCLACAAQNNQIISIEEFNKKEGISNDRKSKPPSPG